jgi:histidine phosphotransferase ChpT
MPVPDLSLAELLAARLCHDLVGPVGAVSNGVELLADGGKPDPEVLELVAGSARQASRRLQVFRVTYGTGNALPSSGIMAEVRRLATALCGDGRISADWPPPSSEVEAVTNKQVARQTLNLFMLAMESLPRGGSIRVVLAGNAGRFRLLMTAAGQHAGLPEEVRVQFTDGAPEVTPRSVTAHLGRIWAKESGGNLEFTAGRDTCSFALDIPVLGKLD